MAENHDKYLIFNLGDEFYGLPISKVREIIQYVHITPLHRADSSFKGVINLRGKIIPIVDMRRKFEMKEIEYGDRTVFIIVDYLGQKGILQMGIVVDAIQEVIDIPESNMEKPPEIGIKLKSHYLYGIARQKDRMIVVINIDRILESEEILTIAKAEGNSLGLKGNDTTTGA
jgi:purine-binding chemotaxis protein CheW